VEPGPVWEGAENLTHIEIRSPDFPAGIQSLYGLRYPRPLVKLVEGLCLNPAKCAASVQIPTTDHATFKAPIKVL
jgi:hypothetical protein